MKIEKVTRRAQEQFQMVLEEQSRLTRVINFCVCVFALLIYFLSLSPCCLCRPFLPIVLYFRLG